MTKVNRLKSVLKRSGMTQAGFAKRLGISEGAISSWLTQHRSPRESLWKKSLPELRKIEKELKANVQTPKTFSDVAISLPFSKDIVSNPETFSTSDLCLATTLSMEFSIQSVDKTNPRKAYFVFIRNTDLERAIDSYYRGDIRVSPRHFFGQIRDIKSRLYQ
jgi:transcriptional regulator with XRE-family HTH domain